MEIERKFLIKELPSDLDAYPHSILEQGYLCTTPVIRIRKDGEKYELTYKSSGLMMREEYNLPLTKEAYQHLLSKVDGNLISKERYRIPLDNTHIIELDIFGGALTPLILAEVEFSSEEDAMAFLPPDWFVKEVTWIIYFTAHHGKSPSPLREVPAFQKPFT